MEQRITIVTLAVEDLARSIAFYEALGWRRSVQAAPGIAFFQCGGIGVALYPAASLARDLARPAVGGGFGGVTIAYNTRTRDETDAVLREAAAAGAKIIKPAEDVFWGGYSGYFADPDGHLWEVAWNPDLPMDSAGAVTFPD